MSTTFDSNSSRSNTSVLPLTFPPPPYIFFVCLFVSVSCFCFHSSFFVFPAVIHVPHEQNGESLSGVEGALAPLHHSGRARPDPPRTPLPSLRDIHPFLRCSIWFLMLCSYMLVVVWLSGFLSFLLLSLGACCHPLPLFLRASAHITILVALCAPRVEALCLQRPNPTTTFVSVWSNDCFNFFHLGVN